jgi:hypothetical protein
VRRSTSPQTEEFCKEFETYIEYAKEELGNCMQGSENAALSTLEEIRLTDSTNAVYFSLSLKKCKR